MALASATPLPTTRSAGMAPALEHHHIRGGRVGEPSTSLRPRSALAITSFSLGVAGIPLLGILVGPVAILFGVAALIRDAERRRGMRFATAGIVLGAVGMALWSILIVRALPHLVAAPADFAPADSRIRLEQIAASDPGIAQALRANVMLTINGTFTQSIGAGVVIRIVEDEAIILTNRHVVEPSFSGRESSAAPEEEVVIRYIDGAESTGHVVWVAPSGIDLALVRSRGVSDAARCAPDEAPLSPAVGEPIFAVGNPHGLGWSFTEGSTSQHRVWRVNGTEVDILQTSAPVNPGNSGGGLYTRSGRLVGINTMTTDKRIGEGLGFAIAMESFWRLAPEWLTRAVSPVSSKGGHR